MPLVSSELQRVWSISSMRSKARPLFSTAKPKTAAAAWAWPICKRPVGDGAKRVREEEDKDAASAALIRLRRRGECVALAI